MRWLLLLLVGLIAGACGLSFNPDLPSGMESDGSSDSNDSSTGDGSTGDGDGGISVRPPTESEATGGAGGAGGATSER